MSAKTLTKKTNVDTDYNRQIKAFNRTNQQLPIKHKLLKQAQDKYQTLQTQPLSEMTSD